MADLLPGVRSRVTTTSQMRTHHLEAGPRTGRPSSSLTTTSPRTRFFEHLLTRADGQHRFIRPGQAGGSGTPRRCP